MVQTAKWFGIATNILHGRGYFNRLFHRNCEHGVFGIGASPLRIETA